MQRHFCKISSSHVKNQSTLPKQAAETCSASIGFKPHLAENFLAKEIICLLLTMFTGASVLSKPLTSIQVLESIEVDTSRRFQMHHLGYVERTMGIKSHTRPPLTKRKASFHGPTLYLNRSAQTRTFGTKLAGQKTGFLNIFQS